MAREQVDELEMLCCDLCENKVEKTALSKCMDCDKYMCKPCTKIHMKLMKDHTVIPGQEGSQDNSVCLSHPDEDIRYYCYNCKTLICSECITNSHSNHKCSKIKTAAKEMATELAKTLETFEANDTVKVKSDIKKAENLLKDNDIQGNLNKQNVKARIDKLVGEIVKNGEKLLQESEKAKEQNKKYLTKVIENLEKKLTEMNDLNRHYSNVLRSGSNTDIITANNQAVSEIDKLKPYSQEFDVHLPKFVPSDTDLSLLQGSIGFFDTLDDLEKGSDFEHSSNTKPSSDPISTSLNSSVDIVSTFNHKQKNIISICPVTDNSALIHCVREYNNDIVDFEGQVQRTVQTDFIGYDFVMTSNSIVATDANKTNIYKLTMGGSEIGTINTMPLYPRCLCISSDGNILVTLVDKLSSYEVNNDSRRCVVRMTLTGQTLDSYECNRDKRFLTYPLSISEKTNGDICVVNRTSESSGQLVILDKNGRLKVTYMGGPEDKQFDPVRVKCDILGHIIVSDRNNKKVHLLGNDCQFVQYVMTEKDLTHEPGPMAIDAHGLLWVGCTKGKVFVIKYIKEY